MKIATFNLENLFHRDEKLVRRTYSLAKTNWVQEMEELMRKTARGMKDLDRMRELSEMIDLQDPDSEPYFVMRKKEGKLYLRQREATPQFKASGLTGWNGWIQVSTRPILDQATDNKASVINEINPDILLVQEVEDRQSLLEFNEDCLPDQVRFTDVMVIPGNNDQGLEMGIMTKNGYKIKSVISHVNDFSDQKRFFDKDFQEYEILTPEGETLWILAAHLQGAGPDKEESKPIRKRQANIIASAYKKLQEKGFQNIILAGTLNASSYCDSLSPLVQRTDLVDVKVHPSFNVSLDEGADADYYSLGAYRMGINTRQHDYLMLSPSVFKALKKSGINRKGVWPKKEGQYRVFPNMKTEIHQASSHPLLWVDFDREKF